MAHHYDVILKEDLEQALPGLLPLLFGIRPQSITFLNPELQHTQTRQADCVLMIVDEKGEKYILQIEFQTTNDARMARRSLVYYALLHDYYELPVLQFVLYLGTAPVNMPVHIKHRLLNYEYHLVDFSTIAYEKLLSSPIPAVNVLAILADFGVQKQDFVIKRTLTILREHAPDEAILRSKLQHVRVLSKLRKLRPEVIKQIKNMPITIDISDDELYLIGKEEGQAKGKTEALRASALGMFKVGLDLATIQTITQLDIDTLFDLQKEAANQDRI